MWQARIGAAPRVLPCSAAQLAGRRPLGGPARSPSARVAHRYPDAVSMRVGPSGLRGQTWQPSGAGTGRAPQGGAAAAGAAGRACLGLCALAGTRGPSACAGAKRTHRRSRRSARPSNTSSVDTPACARAGLATTLSLSHPYTHGTLGVHEVRCCAIVPQTRSRTAPLRLCVSDVRHWLGVATALVRCAAPAEGRVGQGRVQTCSTRRSSPSRRAAAK